MHISPSLIPSTSQPLTPDFPVPGDPLPTPDKHHPVTPRFLLSLLATAVYLSIPSLASQALSSILSTIGPHTVIKYLNFALGRYIGPELDEPEAAVGLECVAHIINDESSIVSTASTVPRMGENNMLRGSQHFNPNEISNSSAATSLCSTSDADSDEDSIEPSSHYGAISDRIGEACACWLTRWGTDLLAYEIQREEGDMRKDLGSSPLISRQRTEIVPSNIASVSAGSSNVTQTIPRIWSRGGLSATWVAAVVSADTFFVKGERERYTFARSVVELRRRGGIIEAEEEEWTKLFEHGIYYANMVIEVFICSVLRSCNLQTMEDIIDISQDISPTTKKPFVPLTILQAAHWDLSLLRNRITGKQPVSAPSSPSMGSTVTQYTTREKELGITHTTTDILARILNQDESTTYFLVPINSSIRIGEGSNDNAENSSITMDQLFASGYPLSQSSPPSPPSIATPGALPVSKLPTPESEFFGLRPSRYTAAACVQSDPASKSRWSPYPPYRFGVEFWDLDSLKEKSRLYSQTICYAGSLFNVYVQVVRKKGQVQLGIYLHRQSSIEPIPWSSAPSSLALNRTRDTSSRNMGVGNHRGTHQMIPSPSGFVTSTSPTISHYSPAIYPSSRSTTPSSPMSTSPIPSSSLSGSPSPLSFGSSNTLTANTLPATSASVAPPQPYRDPRPLISAYFTISCANATGSSQTRFTSSPDVFPVSQSWGWKSSSLRTEEYIDTGDTSDASKPLPGKEVSLRATVVLGLV